MSAPSNRLLVGWLAGSIAGAGALVGVGSLGDSNGGARNGSGRGVTEQVEVSSEKPEYRLYGELCLLAPPAVWSGEPGETCEP